MSLWLIKSYHYDITPNVLLILAKVKVHFTFTVNFFFLFFSIVFIVQESCIVNVIKKVLENLNYVVYRFCIWIISHSHRYLTFPFICHLLVFLAVKNWICVSEKARYIAFFSMYFGHWSHWGHLGIWSHCIDKSNCSVFGDR